MAILQEIFKWASATLAPWERDALRRLFDSADGKLADTDYDDLVALIKTEHGIPDSSGRKSLDLDPASLPGSTVGHTTVVLRDLSQLTHVNRIAPTEVLRFAPQGLTVIFGGNGSGKSGYARVLKRACRARDRGSKILGDVTAAGAASKLASATFGATVNGVDSTHVWTDSLTGGGPDVLSAVAVFDSRCARSYIDEESDVAFMPFGLDVLEALAQHAMPTVKRRLDGELATVVCDASEFYDLQGATSVGVIVSQLQTVNSSAALEEIVKSAAALAELKVADSDRIAILRQTLAVPDPAAEAKKARLALQRVGELVARVSAAVKFTADDVVARAKILDEECEAASAAVTAAAAKFRGDENLLPGTGDGPWRYMFDAAARFAAAAIEAGPAERHFVPPHELGQCALCQRALDDASSARLHRFHEFVVQDLSKNAETLRKERSDRSAAYASRNLSFGVHDSLGKELEELQPGTLARLAAYEQEIEARRRWVVQQFTDHKWNGYPPLDHDALPMIEALCDALRQHATAMEAASDPAERSKHQAELLELQAREALAARMVSFRQHCERRGVRLRLGAAASSIKTKPVSDYARDLASKSVSEDFAGALNDEFQALGVAHIKVKIKTRVDKAATKLKLVLDLPSDAVVRDVLSEGEQRCVALGSFLAEINLSGHVNGIVLDDPVSSLDHQRRHHVASRLVKEATWRQVVVFTHDATFLRELQSALDEQACDGHIQHLEWAGTPGCVRDGLPWDHKPTKDRLSKLRAELHGLKAGWTPYPNADQIGAMRSWFSRFRATIERFVEDVLLNGVVTRFDDRVKAGLIDKVSDLTQAECVEVKRIYQLCHKFIDGHAAVSATLAPGPTPAEAEQELNSIESIGNAIKARRKGP